MNEQEIISRGKALMERGKYADARQVLKQAPRNAIALALLSQIDEKERNYRKKKAAQEQAPAVVVNLAPKQHEIPRPALFIIIGSMVLWSIAIIAFAIVTPSRYPVPIGGLIATLLGGNAFLFFCYYLFYKFYWWMLAFFWLMGSCAACVGLATLPQYLQSLGLWPP